MDGLPTSRQPESAKNREIYDQCNDELWDRAVYSNVHNGWHFTNIGGSGFLDQIARAAALDTTSSVLDLCCGSGAALRYLTSNFGVSATGLDINASQIARAREQAAGQKRLRFVVGDAAAWVPESRHDLVFALDSLTLIPDLGALFSNARRALRDGGMFAVADVVEGLNLTRSMRDFALQEDGAVSLVPAELIAETMARAGFSSIDVHPNSAEAVRVFRQIHDRVHEPMGWDDLPADRVESWRELSARYLSAFQSGELGYATIIGVAA